jgi:putative ABC transport system substrate-binding protein
MLLSTDAFFFSRRAEIVALAARHELPVMYDNREYPVAGGLVSYGADFFNVLQLADVSSIGLLGYVAGIAPLNVEIGLQALPTLSR